MHYVKADTDGTVMVVDVAEGQAPEGWLPAPSLPPEPQHQWVIVDGALATDPTKPPKKTKDDAYWDAIQAATTVAQLKAALLSRR